MTEPFVTVRNQRILRPSLPGGVTAISTTSDFPPAHSKDFTAIADELRELLEGDVSEVIFAEQTHGNEVAWLDGDIDTDQIPGCDGLATNQPGRAVFVRTADCVPVLVSDSRRPFIAAVHAGWRGTFDRILERALQLALDTGSQSRDLWVWLGPHIRRDRYEVSPEIIAGFRERFGHLGEIGRERQLDLTAVNRLQALAMGVPPNQIADCGHCTLERKDLYPSYRRDGECRGQIFTGLILRPSGD
ncbi:peptidoglycan editing factor PgeF [bacterium]|nr:peptidoglycan editing factor PgeF [bacterium]